MYNVAVNSIQFNVLYLVVGSKSVLYNGGEYGTGDFFRGIDGISSFIFIGEGTELITELTELYATGILFEQSNEDKSFPFEETGIKGMSVNYELTAEEKNVQEVTELKGMSLTLLDYPFYTYFINETRFSFNPD